MVAGIAGVFKVTGTRRTRASQRWTTSGVWVRVLAVMQQDDALHTLLLDSTTVRAHQHVSGARKKASRKRRRGGLTCKRDAVADAQRRCLYAAA